MSSVERAQRSATPVVVDPADSRQFRKPEPCSGLGQAACIGKRLRRAGCPLPWRVRHIAA
ncbi:hypothetical protein ALO68_101183 [Pseudomonas syringae pv. helianthi]|uniref:Uncharacterized protein n=2 Tax=Pseudomonas syringae group genomosp. 7 TaxID=251699 RepID=A0A0N8RPB4_9PSED|nr:hypothetical protein ALO68_101183 [Pseudomonas syringae pv. helianthi]KPY87700.1 hypothetical protein ALO44_101088 [Pseudomonas syringae pv. tagetis]RMQ99357.1 hypothetical protein ALP93_100859 [Pseudomonas syringae pv. helianthi]RMV50991.1 hypothetical protein ALP10_100956 [Pseudomonas syringae pv. helianthi]RMW09753.1 hypothetical protein ALO98_100892 [Pseudomonas syringae pv. tagetis]